LYGEGEQDPRADSHRAHDGERNNELIRVLCVVPVGSSSMGGSPLTTKGGDCVALGSWSWVLGGEKQRSADTQKVDRLLANGAAMAAARRKTGGLQWGDFPWESGAKNHRKTMGPWSPSFSGLKNRG